MSDDVAQALGNAALVRKVFPVPGMKVTTVPGMPKWVAVKFGNGQWKQMPVLEAVAYKRMLRARARWQRLVKARTGSKGSE